MVDDAALAAKTACHCVASCGAQTKLITAPQPRALSQARLEHPQRRLLLLTAMLRQPLELSRPLELSGSPAGAQVSAAAAAGVGLPWTAPLEATAVGSLQHCCLPLPGAPCVPRHPTGCPSPGMGGGRAARVRARRPAEACGPIERAAPAVVLAAAGSHPSTFGQP